MVVKWFCIESVSNTFRRRVRYEKLCSFLGRLRLYRLAHKPLHNRFCAGTAKSVLIKTWLDSLDTEKYLQLQINFSSRTTSLDFQRTLEDNIDKRTGRIFGPPSGKILKVFLDDMNMPTVTLSSYF